MQFVPSPHGPTHIRTIWGGEAALDAFLLAETRPPAPTSGQNEPPGPTPTTRSPRMHAPARTKRRAPTPPPHPPAYQRNPPSSPARPPRRSHTYMLQIITQEGDPDRDSIPREGPYVSLVPTTSPWNTLGTDMIGVHNPSGVATLPTLISPQRYEWLHAAHSRLNQGTYFLQNLQSLMLQYHPRAETLNPQDRKYKSVNQCPPSRHYNGPFSSHSKQGRKTTPAPSNAQWRRA